MKKCFLFNIIVMLLFYITGPVYEAGYSFGPGAMMGLGLILPVIISFYVCAVVYSCIYSVVCSFKKRDLKMLIPIAVFVAGFGIYLLFSDADSFWVRVIAYYFGREI